MAVPIEGPEFLEFHQLTMVIGKGYVYRPRQDIPWVKVLDRGGWRS